MMRNLFRAALMLVVLSASLTGLSAQTEPSRPVVEVEPVSDRIAVFTVVAPQSTNVIACNTSEGIVVIDTETSPVFTAAIREKIVEHFGDRPFIYLINTHHHGDHTYGNQVFGDATIIGHELCKAEMLENKDAPEKLAVRITRMLPALQARQEGMEAGTPQAEGMKKTIDYYRGIADGLGEGFSLTCPEKTFTGRSDLGCGDMSFEMRHFGFSHTKSDIVIHCPEEGLVFTGDVFYAGNEPYIDTERVPYIPQMIEVCEWLTGIEDNPGCLIPGHGERLGLSEVGLFRDGLEKIKGEIGGRLSAYTVFTEAYESDGVEAAVKRFEELWGRQDEYFFLFKELDSFVYRIMLEGDQDDALTLFEMLTRHYPDEPMAWDSLGEICMRKELKKRAIECFTKSLELDPSNDNARQRLEELGE